MKLATLKDKTRDGLLHVVNKDLTKAIAPNTMFPSAPKTMQAALDDWEHVHSHLEEIYQYLNEDTIGMAFRHSIVPFDSKETTSPLPRAYQWADGSAYARECVLPSLPHHTD